MSSPVTTTTESWLPDARASRSSAFWVAALGVTVCAVVLRAAFLTADPPPYHPYGTAWGDEGFWNWPAAVRVVQGRRAQIDIPWGREAPLYVAIQMPILAVLGVSLGTVRVASVIAGGLTTLFVIMLVKRPLGLRAALSAGIGYATFFPAIIFERLATPEALVCVFGVCALMSVAEERRHYSMAAAFAVVACLCKISAAPLLVFVAAVVLFDRFFGRHRAEPPQAPVATALLLLFLTLPLVHATYSVAAISRFPVGVLDAVERFARNAAVGATTSWYYLNGIAWTLGAALHMGFAGPADSLRERRLSTLCVLWVAAWFATVPLIDAKGGRLYLLSVPLVISGCLGWGRALEGRLRLEVERSAAGRLRAAGAVVWLLLLTAVFLSERTKVRALVWLPVLVSLSMMANRVTSRLSAGALFTDAVGKKALSWATVTAFALASQLPLYAAWARERTHVVASAHAAAAATFPGSGDVCGQASAVLMLGKPEMGDAIVPGLRSADCRTDGRPAAYVLVPAQNSCLGEFADDWLDRNRPVITQERAVARVSLPGCDYFLYAFGGARASVTVH